MKLKDTRLEVLIDTAKTFTHNDIKEITLAYQCTGTCYKCIRHNDNNCTLSYPPPPPHNILKGFNA